MITYLQSWVNAHNDYIVKVLIRDRISESDNILRCINNDFFYYYSNKFNIKIFKQWFFY